VNKAKDRPPKKSQEPNNNTMSEKQKNKSQKKASQKKKRKEPTKTKKKLPPVPPFHYSQQELVAMKARLKEMEDEANKLRDMQAKVEEEMNTLPGGAEVGRCTLNSTDPPPPRPIG
jgi:hypothetical protein